MQRVSIPPVRILAAVLAALMSHSLAAQRGIGPDRSTPVAPMRRAVNGVTVLEHEARAFDLAPRVTLDPRPIAVLGGAAGDPDYDLTYAHYVELLPDGRVMALAPVGNKLFVFRADGRPERSLGRMGRGPGEIMSPDGLLRLGGDTVLIPDPANARLNWVLPDRGFVASAAIRDVQAINRSAQPAGRLPSGRIVIHSRGLLRRGVSDSVSRPPVPVFLLDPANGAAREITRIPDLEVVMFETRYRGLARLSSTNLRLGRSAHIAVWDSLIATGSGDGYRVDVRAADGRVISSLRVATRRRPVTKPMRDGVIARGLARLDVQGAEALVDPAESRRLAREEPFADSLPPYEAFLVTRSGTLWIVDAIAPTDTTWTATAFRTDGAIVGRLHASVTGRPMLFADDRVIVRATDSDGIVSLIVYRLTRPRP